MGKDYYSILQITRSAKNAEIKQAYRKLALNFHPVKSAGDKSYEDKFKDIAEAYDVLNDRKLFFLGNCFIEKHNVEVKLFLSKKKVNL
jgi:DnaJ-class molecular chaperone